ncbi:MAG: phytanoyl-CoA dioxygenase family protein [bacterium]|nr:phytanoyl-CoA dioxygenase family protein [bacterium]
MSWIHRADAAEILDHKRKKGLVDGAVADQLESLIERGYALLPRAVSPATIDRFAELFDRIWDTPPRGLQYIDGEGAVGPVSAAQRERIVRVVALHLQSADGPEILFPHAVLQLLAAVYERPPVCFQSMSFRHGSQQPIHLDTAYLPLLHDPLDLLASWTALQDVEPGSGELVYYEGSHKITPFLFGGRSKALADGPAQHEEFLQYLTAECERRGLPRRTFTPRKGDVLVWTAELAHGGAPVTRPELLRRSIVCHFMPFGTRPTFYDSSAERVVPYGPAFRLRRASESAGPVSRLLRALAHRT